MARGIFFAVADVAHGEGGKVMKEGKGGIWGGGGGGGATAVVFA